MSYNDATALGALLSSSPDLIFFLDGDGRYRYVGEAAAAVIGRTPADMIGRTAAGIGLSTKNTARFEAHRREVMATARAAGFQRHIAKPFDPAELINAVIEVSWDG